MIFKLTIQKLLSQKIYSAIIVLSLSLSVAIFVTFTESLKSYKQQLYSRVENNELVVGGTQGHLKTILNALHLKTGYINSYKINLLEPLSSYGKVIPIFNRYTAHNRAIIGTTPDYLSSKKYKFKKGNTFLKLGDCVIGIEVARELQISTGDTLISDISATFDVSKSVPVKMKVAGILEAQNSSIDNSIFTDLKTTWTMHGIGHEHSENEESSSAIINLTKRPLTNFHFHGNEKEYPITSALVYPQDKPHKAELQAMGLKNKFQIQIINPRDTLEQVNESLSGISEFFKLLFSIVSIAIGLILFIFFIQSAKIRTVEKQAYQLLGIPKSFYYKLICSEIIILFTLSVIIGILLSFVLQPYIIQQISAIFSA